MSEKPENAEAQATAAADAWLALIDADDVQKSWEEAASLFRAAVTAEVWGDSLHKALGPIGKPMERELDTATYKSELPGAPDGHYVILTYNTRFENKAHGVETVVPMMDADGSWRVSGYFVK